MLHTDLETYASPFTFNADRFICTYQDRKHYNSSPVSAKHSKHSPKYLSRRWHTIDMMNTKDDEQMFFDQDMWGFPNVHFFGFELESEQPP